MFLVLQVDIKCSYTSINEMEIVIICQIMHKHSSHEMLQNCKKMIVLFTNNIS